MLRFDSRLPWLTLLALAVALLCAGGLAVVVGVYGGWPGEVRATVFCEDATGLIRQPANAWSNLGFVLVGVTVALCADRDRTRAGGARNPLTTTWSAPALFVLATVLLGPGSWAMHATNTSWGTKLDVSSMMLWASAVVAYGLCRWTDGGPRRLWLLALGIGGGTTAGYLALGWALPIFGTLLVLATLCELPRLLARPARVERGWLPASVLCFLLALGVWLPSQTDGPWCDPSSRLQGHAVWHVLCALSSGLLYLHFRSERVVEAS